MIEDLSKKYELSEADIERVLAATLAMPLERVANGDAIIGRRKTRHLGQVFGACRSVRSSITLGAGARFMRATYWLAMMDLVAEALDRGADSIVNIRMSTSQGDSYYVSLTGDAVTT